MINHLENSFKNAETNISKITQEIIDMEGMSGIKTRHLYNNLVDFKDSRYLEIGAYKGSSFCAALCDNSIKAVCIDNWSQFGGPKEEFTVNLDKFKGNNDVTIIEEDCFKIDTSKLGKFNIYMYDGNHTQEAHYNSLMHFYPCMEEEFIFIVDDWNWQHVRRGVNDAIGDLNLKVIYEKIIFTSLDNSTNPDSDWWNGCVVFILKKP